MTPTETLALGALRGALIAGLVAALAGCSGGDDASNSERRPQKPNLPTVATHEGPVVGVLDSARHVWSFKGIPFALPPTDERRWRSPQPPAVRAGSFDASQYGNACLQAPENTGLGALGGLPPTGEDCLTLNVWLPEVLPAAPLPVFVWFHGGGFVGGAGSQGLYDGALLTQQGVAVVTVNYRLGALGFLAHSSFIGEEGRLSAGNYGILDQIRALEWVQDNIAAFGGDPRRVTIAGESAGGVSVCVHIASPLSKGLFQAAINQSGPCLSDIAIRDLSATTAAGTPAIDQGDRIATALGCDSAPDVAACLRSKPAQDVMQARPNAIFLSATGAESWLPIVDRHVLEASLAKTMQAGKAHKVPLIIGFTADEGTLLGTLVNGAPTLEANQALLAGLIGEARAAQMIAHYSLDRFGGNASQQLAALIGDGIMLCPGQRAARDHARAGNRVFAYQFTHLTSIGTGLGWGAFHGSDVPFVWGNLPSIGGAQIMATPDELTLIAAVQAYWTSFATNSQPARRRSSGVARLRSQRRSACRPRHPAVPKTRLAESRRLRVLAERARRRSLKRSAHCWTARRDSRLETPNVAPSNIVSHTIVATLIRTSRRTTCPGAPHSAMNRSRPVGSATTCANSQAVLQVIGGETPMARSQ